MIFYMSRRLKGVKMDDLKVFQELLGDTGCSGEVVYASWTDDGVKYTSRGQMQDGLLEVYAEIDGEEEEMLIDVPYSDVIIKAIENYTEQTYVECMVEESHKPTNGKHDSPYRSDKDFYLLVDGNYKRFEPTKIDGIFRIYGEDEVFIESKFLTTSEYHRLAKKDVQESEAE